MIEFYDRDKLMDMTCDTCKSTGEFEGDFMECIDQFKDDNWTVKEVDGEWEHQCPDCINKVMEKKL